MHFEILTTQRFTEELFGLPLHEVKQINEQIWKILPNDPRPDGTKLKKKLGQYKGNICRLRAGDYRAVYTYGNGWVKLIAVRYRPDAYPDRQEEYFTEPAKIDITGAIDSPVIGEPVDWESSTSRHSGIKPVERYLVRTVDRPLLERLGVPDEYHAKLLKCKTEEALLNAQVPGDMLERVINAVVTPELEQVLAQPEMIVQEEDDLIRFVEGDLLGFLLKLSPEQERFVDWGMKGTGPTLVKGGPGTGKSTVALYRTQAIIRALQSEGVRKPRALFTTYTKALVHSSEQLLHRLLGEDAKFVEVRTADSVVNGVFKYLNLRQNYASQRDQMTLLREVIEAAGAREGTQVRSLERMSDDYLLEEINSVIEARELSSLEEYLSASRAGRRVPLTARQRETIWRIYESFGALLDRKGVTTWERTRRKAATLVRAGAGPDRYDGVVVDEVQDLDPSVLRLLVLSCKAPNRLFITADANQSIYGSTFRWTDVHDDLRFRGRAELLRTNYRSTRQIGEAAQAYLRNGALDDAADDREYKLDGEPPIMREVATPTEETKLLLRYFREARKDQRLGTGSCAVLVPANKTGQAIAERLCAAGVKATWMTGDDLDLESPTVKVLNLKSAKGLEFPIVALAGFVENPRFGLQDGGDPEEGLERLQRERRTMFVGMTRAMRMLLVVAPVGDRTPLLADFEAELWNFKQAGVTV
jgi:superfamily I DNA/RNA helicase/mRNA-degrading endonuclease RelE of RelBE toxin-antitoxin system